MIFETPLLLFALAAAPVAWLLGRLRRRRVRVEVSSLLLWDRVAATAGAPPARERRRILDLRTAAEMAAIAALVLAAAGPRLAAGARARRVAIVVDETPSMHANGRMERARAAEAELLARLDAADERVRTSSLLEARAADVDAVYFFTDHDAPPPWEGAPRLVSVLVGGGGPNAGIVAAGGRVGPEGALEIVVRVEGVAMKSLSQAEPRRIEPAPSAPVEVRIPSGDVLGADDSVALIPPGAPPAVAIFGEVPEAVRRALTAAGSVVRAPAGRVAGPSVTVESAAEADRGVGPRIAIAAAAGDGAPPERLVTLASPIFRYSDPAAQRLRVAPAAPPPDLRPVVADERGRTVIGYREEASGPLIWVGIPLAAGDAATDWAKDRSFPLFFAEALRALAPGKSSEDGLWRAAGVLSSAETREAGPAPARPLPPEEPLPAPSSGPKSSRDLAPFALGAGLALTVLALALARERKLPLSEATS